MPVFCMDAFKGLDYFEMLPTEIVIKILRLTDWDTQASFLRSGKKYYVSRAITDVLINDNKRRGIIRRTDFYDIPATFCTKGAFDWLHEQLMQAEAPWREWGIGNLQFLSDNQLLFLIKSGLKPSTATFWLCLDQKKLLTLERIIKYNPNAVDSSGATIINSILGSCHSRPTYSGLVPWLLEQKVDPRIPTTTGQCAGENAVQILESLTEDLDIVAALLPIVKAKAHELNQKDVELK
jgi:hypothetical protein